MIHPIPRGGPVRTSCRADTAFLPQNACIVAGDNCAVELRPYQRECLVRLREAYGAGKRRLLVSLPTGTELHVLRMVEKRTVRRLAGDSRDSRCP